MLIFGVAETRVEVIIEEKEYMVRAESWWLICISWLKSWEL